MMSEHEQKKPLRKPKDFPQLEAATLKDDCFDVPERGTEARRRLQASVDRYFEAKKAGKIPQYPDLAARS